MRKYIAVWIMVCQRVKSNPNLFMSKFEHQFSALAEGISVKLPGCIKLLEVRCILIAGIANTLAKSNFLNLKKIQW